MRAESRAESIYNLLIINGCILWKLLRMQFRKKMNKDVEKFDFFLLG